MQTFLRYTLRHLLAQTDVASAWHADDTLSARGVRINRGRGVAALQMVSSIQQGNQRSHLPQPAIVSLRDAGVFHGPPYQVAAGLRVSH